MIFGEKTFNCAFSRNYMEPHDVCSIVHIDSYLYAQNIFAPALREIERSEISAWILLELMTEVPRCLVLLKESCFWAHAGVWSKLRAV